MEVTSVGSFIILGMTGPIVADEGKERFPTELVTRLWVWVWGWVCRLDFQSFVRIRDIHRRCFGGPVPRMVGKGNNVGARSPTTGVGDRGTCIATTTDATPQFFA